MNDLKKYIKDMRVKDIVSNVFSAGMEFMAKREMTNEDSQKYKKVVVKEIKRRIKND